MSKWKCETPKCKKPCYAEPPESCYPTRCLLSRKNKPNWRKEDEPATTSSQLPKLTAEVFNRPDCPAWAKWAAVDSDGEGWFYEEKPVIGVVDTFVNVTLRAQCIDGEFDASDWQNSLIERPEKKTLPDWCEVGEWMWIKDLNVYFNVDRLDELLAYGKDFCGRNYIVAIENIRQARLRPWTAREAIGKIVCWKGDYSFQENMATINAVDCDGDLMGDLLGNINLEDLTKECFYQLNGNPCGVLEHLENEEWVE